MSYLKKPDYVQTISKTYPDLDILCSDNPYEYDSLDWDGEVAILQSVLDIDQFNLYKLEISEKIRSDATVERFKRMKAILGTDDPEQILTYEEKFSEAVAFMDNPLSPTPIMDAEVFFTGETVADLAPVVVSQYTFAKSTLRGMFGSIEGKRRAELYLVSTMVITSQLENYTGPVWS